MITPEFLQGCTDAQIDRGVAWIKVSEVSITGIGFFIISKYSKNVVKMGCAMFSFHPCSYPNDAWPIMIENDIVVMRRRGIGDRVEHIAYSGIIRTINKNPLRAAMEVYLLMGNK